MRRPLVVIVISCATVLLIAYIGYRLIDPLPPRHFALAAGTPGSEYEKFAREYARILARNGIELEVRNSAGAVENLHLLRDPPSGVQAALTSFIIEQSDTDILYSLGGVSESAIYIFYRGAEPVTLFGQLRGKRLTIGIPGTAVRELFLEILHATDALDASTQFVPMDFTLAIDALLAGEIDIAVVPRSDVTHLQELLHTPGIGLMNVVQAEALSKTVPGLKHVVLWRGIVDLTRDIPSSDVDLLALRNRLLVRKDLHPALQYLLLEAMREVHWAPGPFNRLGEFPAEQPNDLPLSPTAQAFYRSGPTFWQRYTSFWLTSLLDRIVFFVIPVLVALIPIISFAPRIFTWIFVHHIDQLHRALGNLESEFADSADSGRLLDYQTKLAEIESAVRSMKVARPFQADLQRLKIHLRMVQDDLNRIVISTASASTPSARPS
jgi:TRAP-type uncharacterized transport system substrate-binding protein